MSRWNSAVCGLVGIALTIGFFYGFAGYPLLEPDEGRNAEVARAMAETNDYVLPRLNGLPYLDKPVLFFAFGGLSMEVFGATEFAARLPALLATFGSLLLVWGFGRRHFDTPTALTALIATAATPFTLAYSRTVIFDSTLTFFMLGAIFALFEAVEASDPDRGAGWRAGGWAAIALGVLTKGPVALAIPLLAVLPYAAWRRRVRTMIDLTAALLFVAIVLPWVVAVSRVIPNFLEYVVVTETISRLSSNDLGRAEPWWYFLVILPAAALPWSLVVFRNAGALVDWIRQDRDRHVAFFSSWLLAPLVFFSLSTSKRPQYMLPLIPAVAFLAALAWRNRNTFRDARAVGIGVAGIGAFLLAVRTSIPDWVSATPSVTPLIPTTALVLGGVCIVAGGVAAIGFRCRAVAVLGLTLPIAAIPIVGSNLMDAIGNDRSTRDLAAAIATTGGSDTQIVAIETFPLSLPFYLQRPLVVVTADGSEFTSNFLVRHFETVENDPSIRPPGWWREALLDCHRPRVFVVATANAAVVAELEQVLNPIAITRKYAAYGPCGTTAFAVHR